MRLSMVLFWLTVAVGLVFGWNATVGDAALAGMLWPLVLLIGVPAMVLTLRDIVTGRY